MTNLPKKKFLRSEEDGDGPGVLTTLLRVYIEERDRTALDTFFELLYDDHFTDLALQVHGYGKASDVTVKEVIDDSLAKLLEDVTLQKYRKAPESAAEHLKYLLLRRFIDRRRYWDRDHEDVVDHRETIVDKQAQVPEVEVEKREGESIADARLDRALSGLAPQHERILRLKLEGHSYAEICEKLGIEHNSIWKERFRAVEQLLQNLAREAPTMAHRLKDLQRRAEESSKAVRWPSLEQIQAALPTITERVRTVLQRLHYEDVPKETLAEEFGAETLEVLLRRGYDILESRFKVSFPEAFERAAS